MVKPKAFDEHEMTNRELLDKILALRILQQEDATTKKLPQTTIIRNNFRSTLRAILEEIKESL